MVLGAALGAAAAPVLAAVERLPVIDEIMYHPPGDRDDLQYVELYNPGGSAVSLAGWSFNRGVNFVFPAGARLNPDAYLVICRNKAAFVKQYGADVPLAGEFTGRLSHRGEAVQLVDERGTVVDRVVYADREPWPNGADGHSASLERICPYVREAGAENWASSALPQSRRGAGTPGRRNDCFASNLPPVIASVQFEKPAPGRETHVTAEVGAADGVKSVSILWSVLGGAGQSAESEVVMLRSKGDERKGVYEGSIPAQSEGVVTRFRVKATGSEGPARLRPAPNDAHPTYSYATFLNTNGARIAFAYTVNAGASKQARGARVWAETPSQPEPARGDSAFVYVPPDGGEPLLFDYVAIRPRSGGFKVHFQKGRPFKEMTGINVILERSPRWVLSEPLSYELYRLAGVPAPLTEHLRVWVDGRLIGYQLMIEQPNKSFLSRQRRDSEGHLYKLVWQGHGVIGQHEKKTRVDEGHADLVRLIEDLQRTSGTKQWQVIRQNFNVEEIINYYAVSMCIQNWDGFWNNYYAYHDTGGTGKWEMYPWDEDKTWGDFDGTSAAYDWYDMPLTFGMNGSQPPGRDLLSAAGWGHGPHGGPSWWRRPGWFSGPQLANPEFRQRFLARLEEVCQTTFTEEKMLPLIDALEQRLEPDIPVRAQVLRHDPAQEVRTFHNDIQSLRNQVKNRRAYILSELSRNGGTPAGGVAAAPMAPRGSLVVWLWIIAGGVLVLMVALLAVLIIHAMRAPKRVPAQGTGLPPIIHQPRPPPLPPHLLAGRPPPLPPPLPGSSGPTGPEPALPKPQ
jgi:hypothetical protein